jgi:hypothetical protein
VLLHAQTGELLVCPWSMAETAWLDLIALDSGPGIHDIGRAMEDGFSTIGTPGQGIGAIERISGTSSLYSLPGKGTAYWSRFLTGKPNPASLVGVVNIPVHGESACGDGFYFEISGSRSLFMVVDGLGHGAGAAEAAEEAIATVVKFPRETPSEIVYRTHDALKKTRGAAMSLAVADHERSILVYAGVGNVSATLISANGTRSLVSQNGTLGAILPRAVQEYTYPIDPSTSLLMFSDGLSTKSSIAAYPGIQNRHPVLISSVLYRDFGRKRDDATVLFAPLGGMAR